MSEIRDLIKRLIDSETEIQSFPATVKSVDKTAQTCKVKPIDNSPELNDVRLRAAIKDTEDGHIIYPVQDSTVLVTLINNEPSVAFVSYVSEVDEVLMTVETAFKVSIKDKYLELTKDGLYYEGNATDLKSELDKLLDGITQLTVPTAFGPSGVPINSATFTNIKTLIGQIMR